MNYRPLTVFMALLCVLVIPSCDIAFDSPLKTFLEEQTGTITVGQAVPEAGHQLAVGTDGYVCLAAGETAFSIPVDNPLGYELTVENTFTQTKFKDNVEISGVTVVQTGMDTLSVTLSSGTTVGNEGILHIKVKTAKEGRILYEGDIGIAYIDFDARLKQTGGIILSGASFDTSQSYNQDTFEYTIPDAPASFTVQAEAADPAAQVTINGQTATRLMSLLIAPALGDSTVVIWVEDPHGAAPQKYTIHVTRTFLGIAIANEPNQRVYDIQPSQDLGINTGGMVVMDNTGGGTPLGSAQYTLTYDFTSPGEKTVIVSYKGSIATFNVWVVGLTGLTATGPGGYTAALDFDPSSTVIYSKDLGAVDCTVDRLDITALSGVAEADGSSLTIKRSVTLSDTTYTPVNGKASVPLVTGTSPPLNTITITVGIDRDGTINDVSRTYTVTVKRSSLSSGAEFFVSGPGVNPPGNDSSGNGSEEQPYATVSKALTIIKDSMLGSTPGDPYVTITVSGTITRSDSSTDPMVNITAGGYPHIILRGKGGGMEAGILNANGAGMGVTRRVLHIGAGNKVTMGENLTLMGGYNLGSWIGTGVFVDGGSTFTMDGGTVRNNTGGGGVCVSGSGSTFTMNEGIIEENTSGSGGGVRVSGSSTTFVMEGGIIRGNSATGSGFNEGGGGVCVTSGDFTMNGGTIEENTGIRGSVYLRTSGTTFTMNSGIIQNHTGIGVYQESGSTFIMDEDAIIRGNAGGVSVNASTFTMSGNAVIEGNSSAQSGGGVSVGGGSSFTMKGDAVIRNNTCTSTGGADSGGGVSVNTSTFTMSENAVIQDNTTASSKGGGGVIIYNATFTMSGGTIRGNTAVNGSAGGVLIESTSTCTFIKTGGTIYGDDDTTHTAGSTENTASNGNGHAVFVSASPAKKRNADAGTAINLYAKYSGGSWSYDGTPEGISGLGDTTANWD